MKKSVKETLKSVIVLFTIALVCVGLLAVANNFLKYEAKLDKAMAKTLYTVCPTGEASDVNAIEFFELVKADEQIGAVNKKHGSATTKVVAVYRATKGANAGKYIIQSQAQGRDAEVVMLTSYDENGRIMKSINYSQAESYWKKVDESSFDKLIGKDGAIKDTDIAVSTGATISHRAIAKAITVANAMISEMLKVPETEMLPSLQSALLADEYEKVVGISSILDDVNETAPDEDTKVLAVYKATKGENAGKYIVLAQSKNGKWYPPLKMLTAFDEQGKIIKTVCHYCEDSYIGQVNPEWYGNIVGKSGEIVADDFATNTGATNTLATMAKAITLSGTMAQQMQTAPETEMLASLQDALPADGYEKVSGIASVIASVNAIAPDEDTKVIAVYKATKGANAGKYIILAQSKNGKWYPPLKMLTAYDEQGKIIKTVCHYCEDSYIGQVNPEWYGNIAGKTGEIVADDFATNTGATNTLATMAKAITLSNSIATTLTGGNA